MGGGIKRALFRRGRWSFLIIFPPIWPQDRELHQGLLALTLTSYPAAGWRLILRVRQLSK